MKTKIILLAFAVASLLSAADERLETARAALARNELEAAEAALAPFATAERPDPQALVLLSQLRARQKKTKEAITFAEKAVAAAPSSAEFHSNLGSILSYRIGEVNFLQKALIASRMLEAFNKSVELDPDHLEGYIGLARYYMNAPSIAGGGREPAERYAREVEKRNPRLGRIELAQVAEQFGDHARAYELFSEAANVQPSAAWIQAALGHLSEKLGRPDEARAHFTKALALDPRHAPAKTAMARLSP